MLEISDLTKRFSGLLAVDKFNLTVNKGELVGLIGPNGAGKTTVFNLITGFLRATKGKIRFEETDITGKKPHSIAAKGVVRTFQATSLFNDFTVLENVMVACHLHPRTRLLEAILHIPSNQRKEKETQQQALEIIDFVKLNKVKNSIAGGLPHGHKRVLGIAMALASKPKILLLDEPLSGMNTEEVGVAMTLINKIWEQGTGILLIEHNMKAAMNLCQKIAVLSFGKKIAEGSPDEIKQHPEVIQAYLGATQHDA